MTGAEATAASAVPTTARQSADLGPLGWSAARRVAWAAAACTGLWLAVVWALS
jgi:hypothetical protein